MGAVPNRYPLKMHALYPTSERSTHCLCGAGAQCMLEAGDGSFPSRLGLGRVKSQGLGDLGVQDCSLGFFLVKQ